MNPTNSIYKYMMNNEYTLIYISRRPYLTKVKGCMNIIELFRCVYKIRRGGAGPSSPVNLLPSS